MSGLRGYVYDSNGPDMPILAAVFDAMDDLIETMVVQSAEEGAKFIADTLAAFRKPEDIRELAADGG